MVDFFASEKQTQIFRNFSIYSQGSKWGNASRCSIEITMGGGKRFFERGQYIGSSWSVVESAVSIASFVPIGGKTYQQQILRALQAGEYVFVTAGEIGSQIIQLGYMVIKSVRVESDMARGTCSMDITLEGGTPDVLQSSKALPLRLGGF